MANRVWQHYWLKKQPQWMSITFKAIQKIGRSLFLPPAVSLEYRQWRERFILQRFWLSIGLAVVYVTIFGVAIFYERFVNPENWLSYLKQDNMTHMAEPVRQYWIWHEVLTFGLLGLLILFRNSVWGRKYSSLLIVLFPWAVSFIPSMLLGAYFSIPNGPDTTMFMMQVAIAPIHWRLHLFAQVIPILFFFIVYPLIGLTTWGSHSIYSFSSTVSIILICIVCEVGVYLYEQSKQSELESNRRLQLCIHSITHDLRTPVMGSLMLLEAIQKYTPADQPVQIPPAEMSHLIQGYDRLLGLMNTLLDNQTLSHSELILNIQPTNLQAIIATILQDFHPALIKKNIQVNNRIPTDLPTLNIDDRQIWRVLCNLISNALNHNPPGLLITLDATVLPPTSGQPLPWLKVIVQDNGVGIAPHQRQVIFEPYTRAQQTQYQPGLGLGLYICRQVILAHGGKIGCKHLDRGTIFWFTLPTCHF
jgi:signal transduction histidine kinase